MKKVLLVIMFLLTVCIHMQAQNDMYVHHKDFPYLVITKDTTAVIHEVADAEFFSTSSCVIFKVNSTVISPTDSFLVEYRNKVLPYVNSAHLQLRKVFVRGAASPEGGYENNRRLGKARVQAMVTELQRDLQHQYLQCDIETSSITEDYGYLCLLLKEAKDADYARVKAIYDECDGDERLCKQKLMAYGGGALWNRLLRKYFPQLRAARVILWFSEPDSIHAPELQLTDTLTGAPVIEVQEPPVAEVEVQPINPEPVVVEPVEVVPVVIEPEPLALPKVRRHVVAVRTNLVHDLFYMPKYGWAPTPNIQLEFYPWNGHMTFNMGLSWKSYRHWDRQKFYQVRDVQLELRRYFKGQGQFLGFYLGAVAEGTVYGIGFNKKEGWEGEGGAVSLSAGYVMPLTKRKNLRLEFMLAAGYFLTLHDPYVYGNPVTSDENGKYYYNYLGSASKFRKRNHTLSWIGPTNVGIQLTYDILYRHRSKVQKRIEASKLKPENCY